MKDYRNANMNFAPQGAGRPSRDARPEWFNRRFAKRLFCLIMAISLLSNTLGFVADDLSFTQNTLASAEILDINLEPNGGDALNSGDLGGCENITLFDFLILNQTDCTCS